MTTDPTISRSRPGPFLLLGVLLLGAGSVTAQSSGPLTGVSQGFSVDGPTAAIQPVTGATVIAASTGFDATFPAPFVPPPGIADFAALPIPAALEVDALSIGLDWVVSDQAGTMTVPPGNWAALTYTVSRATVGLPGSLVAMEAATPSGAAGDVFSYILPGSALPPAIVGIPQRARDATEISVFTPPATIGNLDAHDLFIGLVYRDNPQFAATLPPPTCYFSVSDATAGSIPAAWAGPALQSGATIFSTTWNPALGGGAGGWDPVVVAYPPAAFGLSAMDDIDAIAVDIVRGEVLFSCDPLTSPLLPPLLWSILGSGTNTEYRMPAGGGPVSTALGVGAAPDDLDGICALDPGAPAIPASLQLYRLIGEPQQPLLPSAPTNLGQSVTRLFDVASNTEFLVSHMTGWPPPFNPVPGVAACAVTIGPPQVGPYVTLGFVGRPDPASPFFQFDGHPERCEWAIPPGFSGTNIPFTVTWAAANNIGFSLSHPVTIHL